MLPARLGRRGVLVSVMCVLLLTCASDDETQNGGGVTGPGTGEDGGGDSGGSTDGSSGEGDGTGGDTTTTGDGDTGGDGEPTGGECLPSCGTVDDCLLGYSLYDHDNFDCDQGACVWGGCNDTTECEECV